MSNNTPSRIDKEFYNWLMEIRRKRLVERVDKDPIPFSQLTRDMMRTDAIKQLELEMLRDKRTLYRRGNQ